MAYILSQTEGEEDIRSRAFWTGSLDLSVGGAHVMRDLFRVHSTPTRREFLRSLGGLALSATCVPGLMGHAQGTSSFLVGVNYPWIAYGHDFGENAWGHDGVITNGWTHQTFADSQGFTDTRLSRETAFSG